jgi:hypothetical protein
MEEKDLNIDLAAVAKEALRDRQPGEDLDESLLRTCKDLYGKLGLTAFRNVGNAVEAYATQKNLAIDVAMQEIAGGQSAAQVTTFTKTFSTQRVVTPMDDLPAEMRERVQKMLESGKSGEIVITKTITGSQALGSLLGFVIKNLVPSPKESADITPRGPTIQPAPTGQPGPTSQPDTILQPATTTQPGLAAQPVRPTQHGMIRCENCRLEYPRERTSCPGCGAERKRSFWARLVGN